MTLAPGARVCVARLTGDPRCCSLKVGDVGTVDHVFPIKPGVRDRPTYGVTTATDQDVMTAGELEPMEG